MKGHSRDYEINFLSLNYRSILLQLNVSDISRVDEKKIVIPSTTRRFIMFVTNKCLLVFELVQGIPIELLECTPNKMSNSLAGLLATNIPFGFLIIGTLQRMVPPQLGEVLNLLPVASCN